MNITLKPEHEKFIQTKLNSGKYTTVDEIITQAFQLLEKRDNNYQKWLEENQEKIQIGIEQLDKGEGIKAEIVINRLKEKISKMQEEIS